MSFETRICNTQASDIHKDSFVGGSLVLVRHLLGHGLQECPPLHCLLMATAWSLPNNVLTKTTRLLVIHCLLSIYITFCIYGPALCINNVS